MTLLDLGVNGKHIWFGETERVYIERSMRSSVGSSTKHHSNRVKGDTGSMGPPRLQGQRLRSGTGWTGRA